MVKKKMVLKVEMKCQKCQTKALQIAAQTQGVESVGLEGDQEEKNQVVVIGDGVDVVGLAKSLRKKVGLTNIIHIVDIQDDS